MTPSVADFVALFAPVAFILKHIDTILGITIIIWAPLLSAYLAKKYWVRWKQAEFIKGFDFQLIEIMLPRDITKTPMAMELVLQSMYQTSSGTWYDQIKVGKLRPWFTLELIADEGNIRFFIRTPKKFIRLIESHLYAQYPGIEVRQVTDYVTKAPYLHEKGEWELWGCEFTLTKPDPYPIRTYVDYGLDKADLDEEFKIDPLNSTIEMMGAIGSHEYIWLQIHIMPVKDRFPTVGKFFNVKYQGWKDEAKSLLKDLKGDGTEKKSKRELDVLHAIEKSLEKLAFDVGMRAIYIGKKGHFQGTTIPGVPGMFRPFSSQDLNGFKPTHTTDFDFPWQDWTGKKLQKKKEEIFKHYVERAYFYGTDSHPFVLSSEELATIWHFPGRVTETPTFARIESRKAEPPANLPI